MDTVAYRYFEVCGLEYILAFDALSDSGEQTPQKILLPVNRVSVSVKRLIPNRR